MAFLIVKFALLSCYRKIVFSSLEHPSHMIKMAAMPIFDKKPSKIFSGTGETWHVHVSLRTRELQ